MTLAKASRALYRINRAAGDLRAARHGPRAFGRRLARRSVWRLAFRALRKVMP